MSSAVYPDNTIVRGLTWTTLKSANFNTLVQESPNKVSTRILQAQNPFWEFSLIYDYLKDNPGDIPIGQSYTDLHILMGFYLARQGQYDSFLFSDPTDHSVGPALDISSAPNLQAQLQLIQDPVTSLWYSPVQRNMGGEFYEDIPDLNGGISVFANAVAQVGGGINYTLLGPGFAGNGFSFEGMYLLWNGTPTGPITAQFNFYFRVRFSMDRQDFENFVYQMWTIGGSEGQQGNGQIKLETVRPFSS